MTSTITVGKLNYDPKHILGRGSFGTVFGGFHVYVESSRDAKSIKVAVKRIERGRGNDSVIQREMDIMKKASNHPNILHYIHSEMNAEFM